MNQELLLKYIAGDASQQEKEEVALWIDSDASHLKEYIAVRRLYETTLWQEKNGPAKEKVVISEMKAAEAATETDETKTAKEKRTYHIGRELLKIAAVAIIVFGLSYIFLSRGDGGENAPDMQTAFVPAGQRAQLTLADGTKVWLNAQTTLTFPSRFTDKIRNVSLDGEAYFEVKSDTEHPFVVHTGQYDVRAVGTEFNVRAYGGKTKFETALFKGIVEVGEPNNQKQIILKPGQYVYQNESDQLQESTISSYDYYQWKDGLICFDDTDFKSLIGQLELFYDVKFVVEKTSILKQKYSGKFRTRSGVEQVLETLRLHTPFKYTKDELTNTITIR